MDDVTKKRTSPFLASQSRSELRIFPWILRYFKKCLRISNALVSPSLSPFFLLFTKGWNTIWHLHHIHNRNSLQTVTFLRRHFQTGMFCVFFFLISIHRIWIKFVFLFFVTFYGLSILFAFVPFAACTIWNEGSWFKAFLNTFFPLKFRRYGCLKLFMNMPLQ